MLHKISLLILTLISASALVSAQGRDISNSEIRDTILSLVQSYSLLDNKLERHEQRERALGELIKKALLTLQKNQRMFEPMKGTFTRLDERVSQIETMLLTQEEKFNSHQEKLTEALEGILVFMNNGMMNNNARGSESDSDGTLSRKLDELSADIKGLRIAVGEIHGLAEENNRQIVNKAEKLVESRLSSADEVISKLEDKLSHFYITSPNGNGNNGNYGNIESTLAKISEQLNNVVDKEFVQGLTNDTLDAITDMRLEVLTASDKTFVKNGNRFKSIETQLNEIIKHVEESSLASETFFNSFDTKNELLKEDIANLSKLEKVMVQTGENVLDVKRRVEFGVHQILLEVNDLIKESSGGLNESLSKRFDEIDSTIMANISSKIETEISQVWRQIGIMYQEISSSKVALDKLQQQTEQYVNGTITTMDSMQGKVALITGRMSEVDENLNYLLGRLSLVTQEFGLIKTGLGDALESIRNSFKAVQEQVHVDKGPGPHNIPDDDRESNTLGRK
uniref:CSON007853 protein n=1 Tax=Culicoides sonorensis TaxID=179676 RepID=A0A336KNC3_CULSO